MRGRLFISSARTMAVRRNGLLRVARDALINSRGSPAETRRRGRGACFPRIFSLRSLLPPSRPPSHLLRRSPPLLSVFASRRFAIDVSFNRPSVVRGPFARNSFAAREGRRIDGKIELNAVERAEERERERETKTEVARVSREAKTELPGIASRLKKID